MNSIDNLIKVLSHMNIELKKNILYDISININHKKNNNHLTLIIDKTSREVLSYGFNYFLKADCFPFSLHSEINTINKFLKKRINHKSKKIMIILKISKTGCIGMSKPCKNCAKYINENYDTLKLSNIYYSYKKEREFKMLELSKDELEKYNTFKISSGFKHIKYKC